LSVTRSVIARFEAERQALALMDHPNIAKVLDAGATETGRPYFVRELVRGIKMTDYCDQNHLATQERLGLFIQVSVPSSSHRSKDIGMGRTAWPFRRTGGAWPQTEAGRTKR
jgi:serine/threonine protein kinase